MYRIGFSEDIHQLVENRKLLLGGIHIPYHLGEKAHSDGDVLIHAIAESMLGALALGDLGKHFPDNSEATLNMDSALILKKVNDMIQTQGYEINNIDASIILEQPKLAGYIQDIRLNLAKILDIDVSRISIKAGTNEKMDEIGKGHAVKAISICMLKKK
jgi:2-C-methyl-D-erythritol 2,4-cyclodiphosphate synthase